MTTTIQKLSIAASTSVLAIGTYTTPAEAARLFNVKITAPAANGFPSLNLIGSFLIDDQVPDTTSSIPKVGVYPNSVLQANVKDLNTSKTYSFEKLDFSIINDFCLCGPGVPNLFGDAIGFSADPVFDFSGSSLNFTGKSFIGLGFLSSQFGSKNLTDTLNSLDGAVGNTVLVGFLNPPNNPSPPIVAIRGVVKISEVPEPASVLGLLAIGALGAGSMLKRKQVTM